MKAGEVERRRIRGVASNDWWVGTGVFGVLQALCYLKDGLTAPSTLASTECRLVSTKCKLSRPDAIGSPSPTLQQVHWGFESPFLPVVPAAFSAPRYFRGSACTRI